MDIENKELKADLEKPIELTLEQEVEMMASCGITISEMALVLGLSPKQFRAQAESLGSKVSNAILAGQLRTEISITTQQKLLAESGNITAVQVFEKRLDRKETQELKERLFYGG